MVACIRSQAGGIALEGRRLHGTVSVLIVGKGGTLGAALAERLQADAIELRAATKFTDDRLANADVVVNASGPRVRPGLQWGDYFREHVGVTSTIARAMRPGAHLVHVSSTAVFGARGTRLSTSDAEAPTLFPSAAYACAKLAAEMAARAIARERKVRITVLRPTMVYGPGVDSALDSIRRLGRRGVCLRLRPARGRQHLVHMDLFVEAVLRATETLPRDDERILIVADPFVLENAELEVLRGLPVNLYLGVARGLHAMAAKLGTSPPLTVDALAILGIDNEFDWRPAFDELGIDVNRFAREKTFAPYWGDGS